MTLPRPRIVFMGTPAFAVESLAACHELGEVVLVVSQPDRPVGRKGIVEAPPVKRWALEHGIQVLQPERLKGGDLHEVVRALDADVSVVAAYGRILPRELLDAPRFGSVNVHASLLPKYRGAAPVQWAIARGERETGVSLMRMEAGLDTGPVFAQSRLEIAPDETGEGLLGKLAFEGARLLQRELIPYLRGERVPEPQDNDAATHAPIIRKEDGRLDFTRPAAELEARLRAFTPWPGAFTELGQKRLKVHRAIVDASTGCQADKVEAGTVLWADERGLAVATSQGAIVFLEVQIEGGRRLSAADFLKGRDVPAGTRLGGDV